MYISDSEISCQGCKAIISMLFRGGGNKYIHSITNHESSNHFYPTDKYKTLMRKEQNIDLLLKVMSIHIKNDDIHKECSIALYRLAGDERKRTSPILVYVISIYSQVKVP